MRSSLFAVQRSSHNLPLLWVQLRERQYGQWLDIFLAIQLPPLPVDGLLGEHALLSGATQRCSFA